MPNPLSTFMDQHPTLKSFLEKVLKDNIGMLASVVAWTLLTSMIPIVAGLVAISALFLRDPNAQQTVISHLSRALAGAFQPSEIQGVVRTATQHSGVLGIVGFLGVLWGGSNVGGAISTVFQPIFQVKGRNFFEEKLIDIGMIFVFTALMLIIILGTTAGALLDRLFSGFHLPGVVAFTAGTIVALLAAFLLFAVIYTVFPNTEPRFKLENVWPGAGIAAVLFEALTYIFPLYTKISHFQHYASVFATLLLLTAWIYFFSLVLIIGAEFVSFQALREAKRVGEPIGPAPDGTVPQRADFRRNPDAEAKV